MRQFKKRFANYITQTLRLPQDVMIDLPRVTMIGQLHLYIENHKGLLTFKEDEVRLLLQSGQLLIKGHSFLIKSMMPGDLLLEGMIIDIRFIDGFEGEG